VGSEFTAEILLGTVAAEANDVGNAAAPHQYRVLLALERHMERRALASMMTSQGITPVECDPNDAIEVLRRAAVNGDVFDRIIVDADGGVIPATSIFRAARELMPDGNVRGLVLVDPLARASLQSYRNHGFEAYLVRPVRPATLLRQIESPGAAAQAASLNPKDEDTARTDAPRDETSADQVGYGKTQIFKPQKRTKPTDPRPHVLLAEDNDINALLAQCIIEKAGCSVALVRNGLEAVQRMQQVGTNPSIQRPDIILMDIFMPEMDGLEAAEQIRQIFDKSPPPMIALTANAFEEDRQRYLNSGLADYLAKPFEIDQLKDMLKRWIPADRLAELS
ncbi:MAG: response regulator, partial [Pseudomonadota bacterium]